MVRYKSFLFTILFFLAQQTGFTQDYPEPRVNALLKDGIIHIINQDYEGARIFFQALDDEYSNLPFGKIYLAAVSIAESYDYVEEFDSDFIYNNLEEVKIDKTKVYSGGINRFISRINQLIYQYGYEKSTIVYLLFDNPKSKLIVTPETVRRTMLVIEAVFESAKENATIKVDI